MRQFTIKPGGGIDSLVLAETARPDPGRGQVVVRVRATSLNFRDLMIANGHYPGGGGFSTGWR